MQAKLAQIERAKEAIKDLNKRSNKDSGTAQAEVKRLFKHIKSVKRSLVTSAKFVGKGQVSDDRRFGRKTLKTAFEETMELPYRRFRLFKKCPDQRLSRPKFHTRAELYFFGSAHRRSAQGESLGRASRPRPGRPAAGLSAGARASAESGGGRPPVQEQAAPELCLESQAAPLFPPQKDRKDGGKALLRPAPKVG